MTSGKFGKLGIIKTISLAVLVFLFFFFGLAPNILDRQMNGLYPRPTSDRNVQIPELHRNLFVVDLHADTLLWDRPILEEASRGHVDLPRLLKGGVSLQVFSVVTQTPLVPNVINNSDGGMGISLLGASQSWPFRTIGSLTEKANYQADKLLTAVEESDGKLKLILNHEDLMRFREEKQADPETVATILAIEGGHALDGDLSNLDVLFKKGFRILSPSHLSDNELAGSQSGRKKYGFTDLGKKWLEEMQKRKLIVDLAHLSATGIDEALDFLKQPPLISHTGIKAVCNKDRNLSDEQIQKIAAKGGLIGVGLWKDALCEPTIEQFAKSIRHICKLVGCQHAALGSDWDGFVTTAVDAAHVGWVTYELQKTGLTEDEIKGVMGENAFRFLLENLP